MLARARLVDPTENLAAARVWLLSGGDDRTVAPAVVDAVRRFYALYRPPPANLVLVTNPRAARDDHRELRRRVRRDRGAVHQRLRLRRGGRAAQASRRTARAAASEGE